MPHPTGAGQAAGADGNPSGQHAEPSWLRAIEQTAANVAEVLRHGGFLIETASSPWQLVSSTRVARLRHYFPDDVPADAPAMLLVPPLMMSSDMWDIEPPRSSAVHDLHGHGIDVWVIDFGRPDKEPGGLKRTLTDHVLALSDAVDIVTTATGRNVTVGGQSQGGMFCYQATAYRRGNGIESVITFGAPVDTRTPLALPLSPDRAAQLGEMLLDLGIVGKRSLPGWAMRTGTRLLDPVAAVKAKVQWWGRINDRESLLPRERQRQFLDGEGWTHYPGPAFAELIEQFMVQNRMLEGGFSFGDRLVTLADIDRPILTVIGERDVLGHPLSCRGIRRAAPDADVYELTLNTGHFGIIASGLARKVTWPSVAGWLHWRNGTGPRPETIVPADEVTSTAMPTPSRQHQLARGVLDHGIGTLYTAKSRIDATGRELRRLADDTVGQLTHATPANVLQALQSLRPTTSQSLGHLLDEVAKHSPHDVVYLYGDRVIRSKEFKFRIDSIVKGLSKIGVRQGERVGVLMGARPSCLSAVAAISRIGATAVMLRSGADTEHEARLGGVSWIIADPEHIADAARVPGVPWCRLGTGPDEFTVPDGVIDLESISVEGIDLPEWYTPNPRRPDDLAFVMFRGSGRLTRAVEITNRRWAHAATSTAIMAGLKPGDTFYAVAPMSHPSSLLVAVGGVVASGARLAFASAPDIDTFWHEVRRYGATHVSYAWSSLSAIADAPASRRERHHPIRLFVGSGMPAGLWQRLETRFAPAKVLDFFASTNGEVILANQPGTAVGSGGLPVPGSARVKVAAYDIGRHRLVTGADGLGRETNHDEPGLLVAEVSSPRLISQAPLRNVFEPGDVWESTGEVFSRDEQGRLRHVDRVAALIPASRTWVSPSRIADALDLVPGVAASVAYGALDEGKVVVVAAVELMPGASLTPAALQRGLSVLTTSEHPHYVHVVEKIATTAWGRYDLEDLRAAGVPGQNGLPLWRRVQDGRVYRRASSSR